MIDRGVKPQHCLVLCPHQGVLQLTKKHSPVFYLWGWFWLGGITLESGNIRDLCFFISRLQRCDALGLVCLVVDRVFRARGFVESFHDLRRCDIRLAASIDLQVISLER